MTVLIIIIALIAALLFLPVGVSGAYDFGEASLKILVGPAKIALLPRKKKEPSPGTEKPKKKKKGKKEKPHKEKAPITFEIIRDYIRLAVDALNRFRVRLTIRDVHIWYLAAAKDPCDAALSYGRSAAAVTGLMDILRCGFNVQKEDLRFAVDFLEEKPRFGVGGTLTIRIGQVLYIGLRAGIDFLKIVFKQRRLRKIKSERTDEYGDASSRRNDGDHDVQDQGDGGRQHHRRHADHHA